MQKAIKNNIFQDLLLIDYDVISARPGFVHPQIKKP